MSVKQPTPDQKLVELKEYFIIIGIQNWGARAGHPDAMCSWSALCEDQKKFNNLLIAPFLPVSVPHVLVDRLSMSNRYFLFSRGLISNLQVPAVKKEEVKEEEKKSEGPTFTPFTGKKYSLRD